MLISKIKDNLYKAQLKREEVKVSTLRLLLSEIRYAVISKGHELSDEEIVSVIQKEIKKRQEGALGFRRGNREEEAQKEEAEAQILESYLPPQLSNEELLEIVQATINEVAASSLADMGKVIGAVMGKVAGRAEGARVSTLVKQKLSE